MKILGVVLVAAGLLVMIVPAFIPAQTEKKHENASGATRMNSGDVIVSVLPLMGVTFVAVGGSILVAGVITRKK